MTDIDAIIEERRTAQGIARKQARSERKLAEHGEVGNGRVDNYQLCADKGGTDPTYLSAKIERDAPGHLW